VIDDSKPLFLKEGQRVTLIAANGSTLKLRGPYDQAPGSGEGRTGPRRVGRPQGADRAEGKSHQRRRRGAAGAAAATLPEPWVLDASRPAIVAFAGDAVVFWRAAAVSTASLTVMPLDKSWRIATIWPSGADRLVVPRELPIHGPSTYLVELDEVQSA